MNMGSPSMEETKLLHTIDSGDKFVEKIKEKIKQPDYYETDSVLFNHDKQYK